MSENCVYPIPDYVVDIFWVFLTVAMVAVIFVIIATTVSVTLNNLIEYYQDRKASYLRNKRTKLELELYEKRQKDDR